MAMYQEFRFSGGDLVSLEVSQLSEVGCKIKTVNTFRLHTFFTATISLYEKEVQVEGLVTRTVYKEEMTVRFTKVAPGGVEIIREWRGCAQPPAPQEGS